MEFGSMISNEWFILLAKRSYRLVQNYPIRNRIVALRNKRSLYLKLWPSSRARTTTIFSWLVRTAYENTTGFFMMHSCHCINKYQTWNNNRPCPLYFYRCNILRKWCFASLRIIFRKVHFTFYDSQSEQHNHLNNFIQLHTKIKL